MQSIGDNMDNITEKLKETKRRLLDQIRNVDSKIGKFTMQDMNCQECLRKHIAASISYAKEIMNGHGKGAMLDHRPDFEGEIVNAEHHAKVTDGANPIALRELRHRMDEASWTPDDTIIDELRHLWTGVGTVAKSPALVSNNIEDYKDYNDATRELYKKYEEAIKKGGCTSCKKRGFLTRMKMLAQAPQTQAELVPVPVEPVKQAQATLVPDRALFCAFNEPFVAYAEKMVASVIWNNPDMQVVCFTTNINKLPPIFEHKNVRIIAETKDIENERFYMNSTRFSRYRPYFDQYKHVVMVDVDCLNVKPYTLEFDEDIAFYYDEKRKETHRLPACFIAINVNENSKEFFKRYAERLAKAEPTWFNDQLILNAVYQEMVGTLKAYHVHHVAYMSKRIKDETIFLQTSMMNKFRITDYTNLYKDIAFKLMREYGMAENILIVGSGPDAIEVKKWDTTGWKVMTINHACDLLPDSDFCIIPNDYNGARPSNTTSRIVVTHADYIKAIKNQKERGDSMIFNAAYFAISLGAKKIGFVGTNLVYTGDQTHFYGNGGKDPLRLGEETLKQKLALLQEQPVELINFSTAKETLLPFKRERFNNPVDVVIPLGNGSKFNNLELKYALESIRRCKNLGNIFIITNNLPDWCGNVIHLKADDVHTKNKDANLFDKVKMACQDSRLSKRFIFWSDDQVALEPVNLAIIPAVYSPAKIENMGDSKWNRRMKHTAEFLKEKGKTYYHWDTHVPQPMDKDEFIRMCNEVDYVTLPGFCINTLYFNYFGYEPKVKQSEVKATIEHVCNDVEDKVVGKTYLGYNDTGFEKVKDYLQKKYEVKMTHNGRVMDDGSIMFPKRGEVPAVLDGYTRSTRDPYILVPMLVPCIHQEEQVIQLSKTITKKIVMCKLFKQRTSAVKCMNCKEKK